GAALVGAKPWWPAVPGSVAATAMGALKPTRSALVDRPHEAPRVFADAGIYLLRTPPEDGPEIWCRCDGGPHGFLSIAAHAHADALSLEVRVGGVDVLADPGTYCYHGEPVWRDYFRSTLGHNTLQVGGRDQSASGGPFLWVRQANSRELEVTGDGAAVASWTAEHDGYQALDQPVVHRRTVALDREQRTLRVTDQLDGASAQDVRLAYHLGPDVRVALDGAVARLEWEADDGTTTATAELPDGLSWTAHRGETEPVLGWYSGRFGQKVPATTLVGSGRVRPATPLVSMFRLPL
ncbi:MAG: heparinase II/III family protein, partial [Kribbellaceae bacterium]